ncbi:hypothetical protein ZOSMA_38G01210 [Zostera marina]|uniref:Uncharacterized protein n=1 Tax=Zostera marina TaxID=29655 RepID=A0A0K9P742_ZOSMR|nr:hypothetical protein ZOSMA_38G01210 [Zostera marina]
MVCTETSSMLGKIEGNSGGFLVDEDYEYLAPKFFDFTNKETRDDFRKAELWFENDNAYDPTPFLIKITGSRFYKTDCDLENLGTNEDINIMRSYAKKVKNAFPEAVDSDDEMDLESCPVQPQCHYDVLAFKRVPGILGNKVSTPKPPLSRYRTDKGEIAHAISSGNHILKQNNTKRYYSSSMHRKHLTPYISSSKNGRATPDISQENQPIKKQKIDDGGIQPIHNGNTRVLYHKLKSNMTPLSTGKNHKVMEKKLSLESLLLNIKIFLYVEHQKSKVLDGSG